MVIITANEAREISTFNRKTPLDKIRNRIANDILAAAQKGEYNVVIEGDIPREIMNELYNKGSIISRLNFLLMEKLLIQRYLGKRGELL